MKITKIRVYMFDILIEKKLDLCRCFGKGTSRR